MNQTELASFVQKHKLGPAYLRQVNDYFAPLARELVNLHQNKKQTIIVNINGAQGSGKSTLSELLVEILQQQYALNAVTLSLDDFYYTHDERQHLGHRIHPLLATRGVPGTHDVMLAHDTLDSLVFHNGAQTVYVPRFNKAVDDRHPETHWSPVSSKPHVIILEGWCVGACAQTVDQLSSPVNALETQEDKDGIWREYVNQQLETQYQTLFARADCTVMLKAPSFECVYRWRLEQENKLIDCLKHNQEHDTRTMNESEIKRFIQHYQRLTEHVLLTLPQQAHYVFELDTQRHIIARHKHGHFNSLAIGALIYTDLDGSLLDHHTYSHEAADITLSYLQDNHVPVIACSSKTQSEIEALRDDLNNQHPFIIENGAAVFIPKGYFKSQPQDTIEYGQYWLKAFVQPHAHWVNQLNDIRTEFSGLYRAFNDMSEAQIADATNLPLQQARLAAQRQFGEPVLWLGNEDDKQRFIRALKQKDVNVLQGGRFLHVCGDANKGAALSWLSDTYQIMHNTSYTTIAIGDSHNDANMLDVADRALIIRSPVHGLPTLSRIDGVTVSHSFGPEGWAEGINIILNSLYAQRT